jgi:protein-S-isoprenylcysteine O-methyltransferase Ste14
MKINLICWSIIIIIFLISGVFNIIKGPKVVKHNYKNNILWLIVPLIFVAVIEFFNHENINFIISYHKIWLPLIGTIILIIGTLFTIWSRFTLGRIWTISATIKTGHRLVTSGPYSVSRNPIYTGLLTMFLGSVFMYGFRSLLYYFIVAVITFEIKILAEEKILIEEFGEEFLVYKKTIPRLLPNILNLLK